MCLAIPGKIKQIKGNIAFFDYEDREYSADISLAPQVRKGDWILMHDGRALSKISAKEAKENLKFIKTHDEMACRD
ncbi:MAG: HypC/HybG/HupF family hydrogenase formation chaperone [Candidatus Berkelbacteria bacterium]|nr:HypC/HybG/HupF family hydrogenase formation chaperone [Candidatus Berkelbacteria bacterium]